MTRRLRWIKLHLETRTDKKLALLSAEQFRVWLNLLLYSAEREPRGIIDYSDKMVVALETSDSDEKLLCGTVSLLLRLGILEQEEELLSFKSFAERQYEKPSDHPAEVRRRVAEHRDRKRGEASE